MKRAVINCSAAVLAAVFGATAWGQSAGTQDNSSAPPARQSRQDGAANSSAENRATNNAGPKHADQKGADDTNRQRSEREGGQASPNAPEGFVLIEERTVLEMANQPEQHFVAAHADLARKDNRGAGEETRMAAAFLDMQAARDHRGADQDKQSLQQQASRLRQIAGQLESSSSAGATPISTEKLDEDFARASAALAKHFDALTKADLQNKRYLAAGYDLDAAANSFKNSVIWSSQKPSGQDLTMIQNAREIAANLRSNQVYQGEQALKSEEKGQQSKAAGDHQDSNSSGKQEQGGSEQPQQAGARLPAGVTHNPLTGTTPAEARNDADHAREMTDALAKAIDQFDGKMSQSSGASASEGDSSAHASRDAKSQ